MKLAKDGIVSHIYPMKGNEEAMGLNMLEHPDRKKEANLAKTSVSIPLQDRFHWSRAETAHCF